MAPSTVLVEVLNGVGTPDAATQAAQALSRYGFRINGTGNAASFDYLTNLIQYSPGSIEAADTVAGYVTGSYRLELDYSLAPDEVWVTLGTSYDGVR